MQTGTETATGEGIERGQPWSRVLGAQRSEKARAKEGIVASQVWKTMGQVQRQAQQGAETCRDTGWGLCEASRRGAVSTPQAEALLMACGMQLPPQPLPGCPICRKAAGYSNQASGRVLHLTPSSELIEPVTEH